MLFSSRPGVMRSGSTADADDGAGTGGGGFGVGAETSAGGGRGGRPAGNAAICFARLNHCRRLRKIWECLNRNALAFLRWAPVRLMLRRHCQAST